MRFCASDSSPDNSARFAITLGMTNEFSLPHIVEVTVSLAPLSCEGG